MKKIVTIGTRGSQLALWQTNFTKDKLIAAGYQVIIKIIKTKGDQIQHIGFDKIEGKGFFTKEIEDALLAKEVDLAVHSCKDLPTENPPGLTIAAYSDRAAVNDVLLISNTGQDKRRNLSLKENAIVGTSSARRKAQLASFRPDVQLKDIRGNVPTRINKLREGQFDAILLAAAGIDRLGLDVSDLTRIDLSPTMYIPAPAQGVLAYQIREDDQNMQPIAKILGATAIHAVNIERKILNAFQGGCQIPLGVFVKEENGLFNCWVSEAKSWDELPKRMHFELTKDFNAKAIVNQFHNFRSKSTFISKDLNVNDYLSRSFQNTDSQLFGESLIEFKSLPFKTELEQYDWLFFVSKNGVKFFFEQTKDLPKSIKIAAINKGSAQTLKSLGYQPDYIGEGGDLTKIAQTFDRNTKGRKVLFVRAKISNRTIQKQLVEKEVDDLIVYDNFMKAIIEERSEEILAFTSPMNVAAYFDKYQLKNNQQLIAIGPTTAKALANYGYTCKTAYEPTMWAILDQIYTC